MQYAQIRAYNPLPGAKHVEITGNMSKGLSQGVWLVLVVLPHLVHAERGKTTISPWNMSYLT